MFLDLQKVKENKIVPALLNAAKSVLSPECRMRLLSEAQKIEDCGNCINTVRCNDCGTNHFRSFTRCKSKYCPLCQNVKSRLWIVELLQWLRQWREQGNYVVFCTFTLKDTDSLNEGLRQLEGAWRLMSTRYRKMFLDHFPGGFRSLEVKTGKNSKQWHPHLHVLFCKNRKCDDTYFLKYIWPKCVAEMGGVANAPEIKTIKPKNRIDKRDENYWDLALVDSLKETCKYITKFDWENEEPDRVGELYDSLRGRRQFAVWGCLSYIRQAVKNAMDKKTDDEIQDFVCQVCGCTRGTPNKLYKAVWEDAFILDYKTSVPESLPSRDLVERIKVDNGFLTNKQKQSQREWVQERIDSSIIPPPRPS